jgi:magnesium transporter
MAFFIPLITATGGNVGIQSSSIIVQDLARDSGPSSFTIGRFFRGFIVAVVNGIAIAGIVLLFNTVLGEEMKQTMVVSIALFSVVILASFTGTMTPLILEKVGVNPALAAGPFITTANDLLGLAIYFTVAHYLYLL